MMGKGFTNRLARGTRNQFVYGARALADPLFYGLMVLGLGGWFLGNPGKDLAWDWLLAKAFFEEFFFRFLLLEALLRVLPSRWRIGPVSAANILVSLGFASMHVARQDPFWALMTFFPALVFGYAWERYRSVLPVTAIHFGFNACLFHRIF
jgi:hypothetical protein